MKAFFAPIHVLGLSCIFIFIEGTGAINSSSSIAGDAGNNSTHNNPEVKNVNDGNSNNHGSSNESSASSSQTSGIDNSNRSNEKNSNGNNNIHQNGASNGHTTYYYNNNNHQNNNQRINPKYDDEQTYLDLFGERAKELLTQHIIPATDAECQWDWRMGRCEPYCSCGLQFLWGDYHIGRSCRFRQHPPPSLDSDGDAVDDSKEEVELETPWQEAWQEVWHSQIKTEGTIVEDVSSFVPPLFPKRRGPNDVLAENTTPWDRTSNTCHLPPESRYIQIIHQLTKATVVTEQLNRLKNATSHVVDASVVHGRHHWSTVRHRACETVKSKVEERAQVRDQPVVLTRQGATWIRRVCGTGSDGSIRRDEDDKEAGVDSDADVDAGEDVADEKVEDDVQEDL